MTNVLTVDLVTLLDRSKAGAAATRTLEQAWKDAQAQPEGARRELLASLQGRREALRQRLIERARPLIAEVARQKGATAVLEKSAVAWTSGEDITAQVMARLDAGGPL
jgi:Skp family chaperone for outer membrane proteins